MKYYNFTILVMFEGHDYNTMFEDIVAIDVEAVKADIEHAYGTPCQLMSIIKQVEV